MPDAAEATVAFLSGSGSAVGPAGRGSCLPRRTIVDQLLDESAAGAQFCSLHDRPGAQLRGLRQRFAKRLWIVCLGYRRHRYELEHPRAPTKAMPLDDALDLANTCLNRIGFLAED